MLQAGTPARLCRLRAMKHPAASTCHRPNPVLRSQRGLWRHSPSSRRHLPFAAKLGRLPSTTWALREDRHHDQAVVPRVPDLAASRMGLVMAAWAAAGQDLATVKMKASPTSGRPSAHTGTRFPQLRVRPEAARPPLSKMLQTSQGKSLSGSQLEAFGRPAPPALHLLRVLEHQVRRRSRQTPLSRGLGQGLWQRGQPSDHRSTACLRSPRCR